MKTISLLTIAGLAIASHAFAVDPAMAAAVASMALASQNARMSAEREMDRQMRDAMDRMNDLSRLSMDTSRKTAEPIMVNPPLEKRAIPVARELQRRVEVQIQREVQPRPVAEVVRAVEARPAVQAVQQVHR